MRQNEKTPTYDETYDSLFRVMKEAQYAMHELGKIEGRNDLGSDEALRYLVLDVSKKIVQALPSYQFERDDIDHAKAVLSTTLDRASDKTEAA
jgi:hypothetical protein